MLRQRQRQLLQQPRLLLDQIIEGHDLVLQFQSNIIRQKEVGVGLLELLPDQSRQGRVDVGLDLERGDDLGLRHVLVETPFYQVLDGLDLRPGVGAGLALAGHGYVAAVTLSSFFGGGCPLAGLALAAPYTAVCRSAFLSFWRSGRILPLRRRLAVRFPREPGQR